MRKVASLEQMSMSRSALMMRETRAVGKIEVPLGGLLVFAGETVDGPGEEGDSGCDIAIGQIVTRFEVEV